MANIPMGKDEFNAAIFAMADQYEKSIPEFDSNDLIKVSALLALAARCLVTRASKGAGLGVALDVGEDLLVKLFHNAVTVERNKLVPSDSLVPTQEEKP